MKREHKPWTETFVPHERWVLPAKRSHADDEEPDADDAAKRRPAQDTTAGSADTAKGRGRVIVQAGLGLCVSFVIAACGSARDNNRSAHVGPPLGDTHISQAPSDPTVPPPDAADDEQPSPGLPISAPGTGPLPSSTAPGLEPAPADQAQPGAFSPPPPSENQPGAAQPQIPEPTPPSTTPLPQQ